MQKLQKWCYFWRSKSYSLNNVEHEWFFTRNRELSWDFGIALNSRYLIQVQRKKLPYVFTLSWMIRNSSGEILMKISNIYWYLLIYICTDIFLTNFFTFPWVSLRNKIKDTCIYVILCENCKKDVIFDVANRIHWVMLKMNDFLPEIVNFT